MNEQNGSRKNVDYERSEQMLYEVEIDQENKTWKVLAKDAIRTENGFQDKLVAVFYSERELNIFIKVLNQEW